jgi:hypothetical protein
MDFNMLNNSVPNLNEITNINNLEKYNVIPNPGLQSKLINRPHKVVVPLDSVSDNTTFQIDLNETFKDVVSVKLLNGIFIGELHNNNTEIQILYITVFIDELKKNYGPDNIFDTSFATLDYDSSYNIDNNNSNHIHNIYKNSFDKHQDIRYFDPPLNSLSKLTVKIQGNLGEFENNSGKLELLIETKEKLRVY